MSFQTHPGTRLYNFYGSTESGCSCILNFSQEKKGRLCIGKPTKNAEFIFADENKEEIKAAKDRPGLLACKGAMNMKGYYHEAALTEEVMKDGYVYSNDLAYMDEEGYIYVLGRKGDVIESGGNKIAPEEVEDVARRIPGIEDCACVPMEDPLLNYAPKLFYVRAISDHTGGRSGEALGEEDDRQRIWEFLRENLEAYKVPKLIEEVKEIPRTYNGKLKRNQLK